MKTLLVLLSFISLNALAGTDCIGEASNIAKMNLDQKAKAYGFESSDLEAIPSDISTAKKADESSLFKFVGYIYKASYEVSVSIDSSCGVEAVVIKEVL